MDLGVPSVPVINESAVTELRGIDFVIVGIGLDILGAAPTLKRQYCISDIL